MSIEVSFRAADTEEETELGYVEPGTVGEFLSEGTRRLMYSVFAFPKTPVPK